jgi:hypothetical protein
LFDITMVVGTIGPHGRVRIGFFYRGEG